MYTSGRAAAETSLTGGSMKPALSGVMIWVWVWKFLDKLVAIQDHDLPGSNHRNSKSLWGSS